MKTYHILKSFKGSQTGTDSQEFVAGTTVPVSDHLATAIAGTGWIEAATNETPDVPAVGARETKVEAPAETKVEQAAEEKKPGKKKR